MPLPVSPHDASPTSAFLVRDDTRDLRRVERATGPALPHPGRRIGAQTMPGVAVASGVTVQSGAPAQRRLALARALAADLELGTGSGEPLGTSRPHVHSVLARVASYPGVRMVALLTEDGKELESVAHPDERPSQLATMVASLRVLSDLALDCLDGGGTRALSATAEACRIELRVVGGRHLLVATVDDTMPGDRFQPVLDVAASSLAALLDR